MYILEAGRRKEKEHQEKFEFILAARVSGFKGHLGQIRALEDLAADGLWRDDFDLHGIHLEGLRVPGCRWRGADFTGSLLKGANFRHADLQRASFMNADLSGSDLRDADLREANFTNSLLIDVDLRGVTSDEGFRAATHPQPLEK